MKRHQHLLHFILDWPVVTQFFYVDAPLFVFNFFILQTIKASGINKKIATNYLLLSSALLFLALGFITDVIQNIPNRYDASPSPCYAT